LFLFADENTRTLKLVDPIKAKIVLERIMPKETLIGFAPDVCLLAIDGSGKIIYWNLETIEEFEQQVKLEDEEFGLIPSEETPTKRLSLQLFGDKLLVLPFSSAYKYSMQIYPLESERGFVQVSGSVFAVSIKNGSPVWDRVVPVKDYRFPLNQDRTQSPAAFFVRRIALSRVNNGGLGEIACIAAIDLLTGKVLYENSETPGVKQAKSFSQRIDTSTHRIQCFYNGILFDFAWSSEQQSDENNPKTVGFLVEGEYKEKIKSLFKKLKEEREKADELPSRGLPPLPPKS
jgi:hypothetical protein